MSEQVAPVPPVDSRIHKICDGLQNNPDASEELFPGLNNLLSTYLDHSEDPNKDDVSREYFIRELLKVFKTSTDNTYEDETAKFTAQEQQSLEQFVNGAPANEVGKTYSQGPSPGFIQEMQKMHDAAEAKIAEHMAHVEEQVEGTFEKLENWFKEKLPRLFGDDKMMQYKDARFQNWGLTQHNVPKFTYVPHTTKDVQQVVEFAKKSNMSVRCAGYRHSWGPVFAEQGQILISLLNLSKAENLPNTTSLPFKESKPTELESIEMAPDPKSGPLPGGKKLVRVGAAVTNERLRRWCVQNNKVTLPLNVIMVEITLGGSNAPVCHGAGLRHRTLSDLVKRIEYVDCNGQLQTITEGEPEFLKAASGCFGLMGVITHLTMAFDPMTYAEMWPRKLPVGLAIPPPPGYKLPEKIADKYSKYKPEEIAEAQKDFERRALNDYYAEWFWFPYSDYVWVNTWNTTTDAKNVVNYPSDAGIFLQFGETVLMNILQYTPLIQKLANLTHLNQAGTTIISRLAMLQLPERKPNEAPIKTYVTDALHFQRAIQNVRVRDTEIEMPLLPSTSDPKKPDFELVQRAWWDAIAICYEHTVTCPQRMPLEMRIMGGSDVIMAPQRGNALGTCSIEVLTMESCREIWPAYAQEVINKWTSYNVKVKPHWAKEWKSFNVDGKPWLEKLKNEDYKEEIEEFKGVLTKIGHKHGWSLEDARKRFSNDLYNDLIFNQPAHTTNGGAINGK